MRLQGQVTAFIIVAAVIIILISLFLYVTGRVQEEKSQAETLSRFVREASPDVNQFVTGCLVKSVDAALDIAGSQGGYVFSSPIPGWVEIGGVQVHYGSLYGWNVFPQREEVASQQLGPYIEDQVEDCIDKLSSFRHLGSLAVQPGKADVIINDESVVVTLHMPVTITTPSYSHTLSDFSASVPVRLGHILDIANSIADSSSLHPNWIQASYLDGLDVDTKALPFHDQEVLYQIEDPKSLVKGRPFVFQFAVKLYNNSAPELLPMPNIQVRVGQTFQQAIAAIDFDEEELTYFLDSDIGTLDAGTGLLEISPQASQIGKHLAVIHARDSFGLEATSPFIIEVEP